MCSLSCCCKRYNARQGLIYWRGNEFDSTDTRACACAQALAVIQLLLKLLFFCRDSTSGRHSTALLPRIFRSDEISNYSYARNVICVVMKELIFEVLWHLFECSSLSLSVCLVSSDYWRRHRSKMFSRTGSVTESLGAMLAVVQLMYNFLRATTLICDAVRWRLSQW